MSNGYPTTDEDRIGTPKSIIVNSTDSKLAPK